MRKNELSNKIAKLRIKNLLKEGYTKAELSRRMRLAYKTIENILDPKKELIKLETHEKIQEFWDTLQSMIEKEQTTDSYFLTDEDIIDRKDAEEGAKEITRWVYITTIIVAAILTGIIFLIKYILSL
ncbi:MAG: hypothetical protein ACO3UU_07160 [Minisyncoccia bacterium]|jgi:hypothetical protein